MANVAFLGLGVMGYPMAGHLQSAGHSVTVYNRTATKAEALRVTADVNKMMKARGPDSLPLYTVISWMLPLGIVIHWPILY